MPDRFWTSATLAFTSGVLGAAANRITLFILGVIQVIPAPAVTKPWIYSALVWGGLWGFLFLIPWKANWWARGIVFGLGPSLGVWLVVFPLVANVGLFGVQRGVMGLVVPFVANSVWGLLASWWYEYVGSGKSAAA